MEVSKVNMTWEKKRKKSYIFPVVEKNENIAIERIHPLKQRLVNQLNREIHDNRIKGIYIFGSSTNICCGIYSDIDIAISLVPEQINRQTKNEISEKIQQICNWNADIVWIDRITKEDKIYQDIRKGVKIYE